MHVSWHERVYGCHAKLYSPLFYLSYMLEFICLHRVTISCYALFQYKDKIYYLYSNFNGKKPSRIILIRRDKTVRFWQRDTPLVTCTHPLLVDSARSPLVALPYPLPPDSPPPLRIVARMAFNSRHVRKWCKIINIQFNDATQDDIVISIDDDSNEWNKIVLNFSRHPSRESIIPRDPSRIQFVPATTPPASSSVATHRRRVATTTSCVVPLVSPILKNRLERIRLEKIRPVVD